MEELFRAKSISTKNGMLKNLDLNLFRGESLGILGMQESGKGTLLDVISGTSDISDGTLFWDIGEKAKGRNGTRPCIHRVSAVSTFVPDMSLWENILLIRRKKAVLVNPVTAIRRTTAMFRDFNIDLDPKISARNLSTFDRYQIELLLARMEQAEIVLFDTISTDLDADECSRLLLIMEHLKSENMSFVITCFREGPIRLFCDRIAFMVNGRVVNCVSNSTSNTQCIDNMLAIMTARAYNRIKTGDNKTEELLHIKGAFQNNDGSVSHDLWINRGEIVALTDPDGKWIEHINRLLFRHFEAKNTETIFCGKRVRRLPPFGMNHSVAVLDTANIDSTVGWMSPEENIGLGIMERFSSLGFIKNSLFRLVRSDFEEWYGEKIGNFRNCHELNRYFRIAMWLYKLYIARPKLVICKNFTTYIDKGMQWMLIETFEKLAENGTGILLMVNGNEAIEDVANRYVVVSSQVVLSEGTYSDMRRLLQLF